MNLDDFIKDFLDEAFEKVEIIDDNLLDLENNPENEEYLNEIFRAAHTVKGSAGTMGYENLTNLMHRIENIFTMLKEKELTFTADINDVILKGMDIVKDMLSSIKEIGEEKGDASHVVKELDYIVEHKEVSGADSKKAKKTSKTKKSKAKTKAAKTSKTKKTKSNKEDEVEEDKDEVVEEKKSGPDHNIILSDIELNIIEQEKRQNKNIYKLIINFSKLSAMPSVGRFLLLREIENYAKIIKADPDVDALNEEGFIEAGKFILAMETSIEDLIPKISFPNEIENIDYVVYGSSEGTTEDSEEDDIISDDSETEEAFIENSTVEKTSTKTEVVQSLRVDSIKIDTLLNLIGEAVINTSRYFRMENELDKHISSLKMTISNMAMTKSNGNNELTEKLNNIFHSFKRLSEEFKETDLMTRRLNNEMQQNTMKIRMLPIDKVFKRFPRMVRDISRELGKKINLDIIGKETELDKTVIEVLGDPMVHIIRNALDHGIEKEEDRIAAGKSAEGKITLRAKHEGNFIYIEVEDDGKGLSREKILKKAMDKGLVSETQGSVMPDKEVFSMIFESGFSTAETITGLSGRGVGMDVVKKSMEKVNGSVEIESEEGKGSVVRIKLPLTMAIIQALLVKGMDQVYSIPITSVEETVKLHKEEVYTVKGNKTVNIRNNVISVISIEELFNYPEKERDEYYIVILEVNSKHVGLIVDKLYGEQEIVIKNLDSEMISTPGIAGANILGDGRVSLILDINRLIEKVN